MSKKSKKMNVGTTGMHVCKRAKQHKEHGSVLFEYLECLGGRCVVIPQWNLVFVAVLDVEIGACNCITAKQVKTNKHEKSKKKSSALVPMASQ